MLKLWLPSDAVCARTCELTLNFVCVSVDMPGEGVTDPQAFIL